MGRGQPDTPDAGLRAWLDSLAALGGAVSALEAVVATPDELLFRHASGFRVGGERLIASSGARFDAASLTKPWMATLALALGADSDGKEAELQGATFEELLRHRSGLPAWTPLALRLGHRVASRRELREFLLAELGRAALHLAASGEGSATAGPVYSDLGYLLWGLMTEERCADSLAELLDQRVCEPLGLAPLGRLSAEPPLPVECRLDNFREVELAAAQGFKIGRQRSFHLGVPQDGNARALRHAGILGAHAGLFVTAGEMVALGREWLRPGRLLSAAQVGAALGGEGDYALGWARGREDGSAGPALSSRSFGHTGFTGGSLWIDPKREWIFVLLAHRLGSSIDLQPVRRQFHQRAVALG